MSQTKACSKCKKELPLGAFSKDSHKRDGLRCRCRDCDNKSQRDSHKKHLAKARKQGREANRRSYEKYGHSKRCPHKMRIRCQVCHALKTGRLVKPAHCRASSKSCSGPIQAHHADYNKPLEVMWLCRAHHYAWHQMFRPVEIRELSAPPKGVHNVG